MRGLLSSSTAMTSNKVSRSTCCRAMRRARAALIAGTAVSNNTGKPAAASAEALRRPYRRAAIPPGSVGRRRARSSRASPQRDRSVSRSSEGSRRLPLCDAAPAAAQSKPSMNMAPRCVLTPPVAASIRASASMPHCCSACNDAPSAPSVAMRTK
jgi:hypothetical protein